ncbi:MAG: DUF47 family protein [Candidatus Helarchaeota archaeon]|nr:DUF47 family protein [Candidatus Helarchaeota archaeon]
MTDKKEKRKLEDVMREFNALLVEGITVFKEAIHFLCDNKHSEFNKKVKLIIEVEKKADRLKEELIEKFIKRETLAFSRADRIELIERIDIVLDRIEYATRTIQTHSTLIKDYSIVADHFKKFTNDLAEAVKTLSNAIDVAEDDLQKAIEATKLVEELRRHARNHSFEIMEDIIKGKVDNPEKMLLYTSTEYLIAILDESEETSDFLRKIAIKYLVLE